MKRYIRTNTGVVYDLEGKEISSYEYINKEEARKSYCVDEPFYMIYFYDEDRGSYRETDGKGGHSMDSVYESEIYGMYDTIEELCDEFTYEKELLSPWYMSPRESLAESWKNRIEDEFKYKNHKDIYGLVWAEVELLNNKTAYRLEPVATVNELCHLVLIKKQGE